MLKEKGLDVDFMIGDIEELIERTEDAKARLEGLKKQQLMSMSESPIREVSPTSATVAHLDMAAREFRGDEAVLKHYRRVLMRKGGTEGDSMNS